jgi:rare lipoprotein A
MIIVKVLLFCLTTLFFSVSNAQTVSDYLCVEQGLASYYGSQFHGKLTANGERFDQMALTAAHRSLPFGSIIRVTNRVNYKSVIVRINDRGPFNKKRIIDLSKGAAIQIGLDDIGVGEVVLECIYDPSFSNPAPQIKIDTLP